MESNKASNFHIRRVGKSDLFQVIDKRNDRPVSSPAPMDEAQKDFVGYVDSPDIYPYVWPSCR